ncbi:hypothetical protein, partial [Salmonella sp. s58079]|uniref:hypothetical protein n=1 Tax=Salmonella sp. s58079 TaxID=3159700 RepID=UPI00397FA489
AEKAVGKEEFQGEWSAPVADIAPLEVQDWSDNVQVPSVPIQQFPAAIEAAAAKPAPTAEGFSEDWSAQTATEDWSAAPTAQAGDWGGSTAEWS